MSLRLLSHEPLRVAPELIGMPIATPTRRALAFVADYLLLLVPTVAVALGAAYLSLRVTEPAALDGLMRLVRRGSASAEEHRSSVRATVALLARHHAEGMPAAAIAAVEEGDLDRAAALTEDCNFVFSLAIGDFGEPKLPARTVRIQIGDLVPKGLRALAIYGVLAAYFTLLTSFGGRTIGKRLLGIRVAPLNGHRLSLTESLERFVGYLHIPGSLGLSLLYLWRDPNRRLPHDRVAGTVVLRAVRRSRAPSARPA